MPNHASQVHYGDVIMGAMASQITSLTIVYLAVYTRADQRKHQSSASLAFVRGIHRGPVNSPHKWPVTRKMFPLDDITMLGLMRQPQTSMKVGPSFPDNNAGWPDVVPTLVLSSRRWANIRPTFSAVWVSSTSGRQFRRWANVGQKETTTKSLRAIYTAYKMIYTVITKVRGCYIEGLKPGFVNNLMDWSIHWHVPNLICVSP